DYERVYTTDKHFSFCECSRIVSTTGEFEDAHFRLFKGDSISALRTEIESMTHLLEREKNKGDVRIFQKGLVAEGLDKGFAVKWCKGKSYSYDMRLSCEKVLREVLLYHFVIEKRRQYFVCPKWVVVPDQFYVTQTGFYTTKKLRYHSILNVQRIIFSHMRYAVKNPIKECRWLARKLKRLIK
ncbi:MAG: hypothetical protein ABI210_02565, partial [Abditibacteriaceae bacterium]